MEPQGFSGEWIPTRRKALSAPELPPYTAAHADNPPYHPDPSAHWKFADVGLRAGGLGLFPRGRTSPPDYSRPGPDEGLTSAERLALLLSDPDDGERKTQP